MPFIRPRAAQPPYVRGRRFRRDEVEQPGPPIREQQLGRVDDFEPSLAVSAADRQDFFLYIDEFQHFITPSVADLLSGVRKYRLGLVLAHQDLQQLVQRDREVAASILTNAGTRVCFRVSEGDARTLADGFAHFEGRDLQTLGIGAALCRVERADHDFNLRTDELAKLEPDEAERTRAEVCAASRERYASEVKASIAEPSQERSPAGEEQTPSPSTVLRPPRSAQVQPPSRGRGGAQHKYLQALIKRIGESAGFRATIEKDVLGGVGKVDVALERDDCRIACEISISTTLEHEIGNVQKCLAAGFDRVFLVLQDVAAATRATRAVEKTLGAEVQVRCVTPEQIISEIGSAAVQPEGSEETVKGYRVKVAYRATDQPEANQRKRAISEVILDSMKRLRR